MTAIINNTELLEDMKRGKAWKKFCTYSENQMDCPRMIEGLDHIEETENQIKLHDIGCNGKWIDIIIRRDRGWRKS